MEIFEEDKTFNIASTIINENMRVSTAAIFYDEWFGKRYQMETWVFVKEGKGSKYKIHSVSENQEGIDYCKKFHNKLSNILKIRLCKDK